VALAGQRTGSLQLLPTPLAQVEPWSEEASTPSLHDGFFYALFEKR